MLELYERFTREVDERSSTSWDWSLE